MAYFDTNPKKLKEDLLVSIDRGNTALPDFQREFVWQPGQTLALIVSLAQRFPAGSLLRLEIGADNVFQAREFSGASPLSENITPQFLMLDGQQRLTSLYQALYGKGEHRYYFSFRKLLFLKKSLEDAFFFERVKDQKAPYQTIEPQVIWGVLPLEVIFGGKGFYEWLYERFAKQLNIMRIAGKAPDYDLGDDRTVEEIAKLYRSYIEPLERYEFPVVTLARETSLEAVCTIFETLNSTGVKLSVFDLLNARFFYLGLNLRNLWLQALENARYFKRFDIDPYYVLQVISAVETRTTIKRGDILKLKPDIVSKHWDDAIYGMEEALDMLFRQCGVFKPDLLSYNTILVPLAAIFMKYRHLKQEAKGALRIKLKCWYWCSVFSQKYESNPTTQSITDLEELSIWIDGGNSPSSVTEFKFEPTNLFHTTFRQRAVYRGILSLLLSKRLLDFHSEKPVDDSVMEANGVDDHHIFPDAYLQVNYPALKENERNSIVNRTLIDRATNQSIGKKAPSLYLQEIENAWGNATNLDRVLESHFLPSSTQSSLRQNDFESFRRERAENLYNLILEATCKEE